MCEPAYMKVVYKLPPPVYHSKNYSTTTITNYYYIGKYIT